MSAYRVALVMFACTNGVALAANPDNGSTLAQRWCTGCHVVSGDQVKGTDLAPSFASIAERPDYNVEKLSISKEYAEDEAPAYLDWFEPQSVAARARSQPPP